jgi:hypothetical protein
LEKYERRLEKYERRLKKCERRLEKCERRLEKCERRFGEYCRRSSLAPLNFVVCNIRHVTYDKVGSSDSSCKGSSFVATLKGLELPTTIYKPIF